MTKPRRRHRAVPSEKDIDPVSKVIKANLRNDDAPASFRMLMAGQKLLQDKLNGVKDKNKEKRALIKFSEDSAKGKSSAKRSREAADEKAPAKKTTTGATQNDPNATLSSSAKRRKRRKQELEAIESPKIAGDAPDDSNAAPVSKLRDFSELQDPVKFGDVVQEPPSLRVSKKMQTRKMEMALATSVTVKKGKTAAEKRQLEVEREKMIQLYRDLKSQRDLERTLANRSPHD